MTFAPTLALMLGVFIGIARKRDAVSVFGAWAKTLSQYLLQASIVLLGFDMKLEQVLSAGRSGFVYTLSGIVFALLVGTFLGRVLGVPRKIAYLVSVGTAICGGSAIAAVGPVVLASDEEMSVSIGTVFLLNAVGLVLFPVIGAALHMTQPEFGLWAALAIHDTSSVVGAAARVGTIALTIATTVKLARALWIVPLTLVTAAISAMGAKQRGSSAASKAKIKWPWFILLFLGAAAMRMYVPALEGLYPWLAKGGRVGLTVTLFLIGTGMTRSSLAKVGVRPLMQGVILWIIVATVTLAVILTHPATSKTTRSDGDGGCKTQSLEATFASRS